MSVPEPGIFFHFKLCDAWERIIKYLENTSLLFRTEDLKEICIIGLGSWKMDVILIVELQ